jgi:pimeloyl-ACP methyl ester carboxylesterase
MHALTLIPLLLVLGWLLGPAGLGLLVVALVVATIIAGLLHASPRPPELRISAVMRLLCWVEEIIAGMVIIFITMPFERLMMPRDMPARRGDACPVLLVHGYINNAGAMFGLYDELARQGYGVYTINLEPVHGDIDRHAARIQARVQGILRSSGADRVTLVAHSMGGLAARAYLRAYPDAPLEQLITLGSPHQGTPAAYTAWGRAGKQMRPGSAWLAALDQHEHERAAQSGTRWPCPVATLFSYDDNIAFPQLCAKLEGAREIAIAGIGHMSMPMSRRVARLVIAELT